MRLIVDADTLCFSSAAMAEGMDATQACWNVDRGLESLLARLNNFNYSLYLTGDNNFRYKIFPEYKRTRRAKANPEFLKVAKEHLVKEYGAVLSDGCEADDLCGVDQTQSALNGEDTIICSIDKDLDQIAGRHYSPAIVRLGIVVREEKEYYVSPKDGLRFFYRQMLIGDSGDGIPGAKGIGKVKAEAILKDLDTEEELLNAVRDCYSCDEEMLMNGQCLYIWREMNKMWEIPNFTE